MKKKKQKVRYYNDPLNDDFMHTKTNLNVLIDDKYEYLTKSKLKKFTSFFLYYFFAIPILWFEGKFLKGIKVVGKKKLKALKKTGYVLYANHTNVRDAFIGQVFITCPKRTYLICNKDAVSIKGIRNITSSLGALPVPDTIGGLKNLNKTVSTLLKKKRAIIVYPEAHLWPYYTGVRPFPVTSFNYCASNNVPCVPVAITYQKPVPLVRKFRKPKMVIYIGNPVFPQEDLSNKENAKMLRDKTYEFIKFSTDQFSTFKVYDYVQKE